MSPPTYVAPSGPAKNLRSRATPTPPVHGGASNPDSSSTLAPPPTIPWDSATTGAPPHCKDHFEQNMRNPTINLIHEFGNPLGNPFPSYTV